MTTLYKLTDRNDQTHGGCQWGPGVTVETNGEGGLCGPGLSHWYLDPLLAVMLNPIHGKYDLSTAHLWRGKGEVKTDKGIEVGCTRATTLERIPLPQVTVQQRIKFGILCALAVPQSEAFRAWADGWLSGGDRSEGAARAMAAAAAESAAEAEARAAMAAARTAQAAAQAAAWAEAWAAEPEAEPEAAALAAEAAARAAVWAAAWAQAGAGAGDTIDLIGIAHRAAEAVQ